MLHSFLMESCVTCLSTLMIQKHLIQADLIQRTRSKKKTKTNSSTTKHTIFSYLQAQLICIFSFWCWSSWLHWETVCNGMYAVTSEHVYIQWIVQDTLGSHYRGVLISEVTNISM